MSGMWRAYVGDGTGEPAYVEFDEPGLTWQAAAARVLERLRAQPDEPDCPGCQADKDFGIAALESGTPRTVVCDVDGVVFSVTATAEDVPL